MKNRKPETEIGTGNRSGPFFISGLFPVSCFLFPVSGFRFLSSFGSGSSGSGQTARTGRDGASPPLDQNSLARIIVGAPVGEIELPKPNNPTREENHVAAHQ
jgi:hypothetical protein